MEATEGRMESCTTGRSRALGESDSARSCNSCEERRRPLSRYSEPWRRSARRLPSSRRKKSEVCSSMWTCAWYPAAASSWLRARMAPLRRGFHGRTQDRGSQLPEGRKQRVHLQNVEFGEQEVEQIAEGTAHGVAGSVGIGGERDHFIGEGQAGECGAQLVDRGLGKNEFSHRRAGG